MDFAPTTNYIVDVTTADKQELMSALADVSGIVSVQDGGVYREDSAYSQVHIEALNAVWSLAQLDELLYSLNYDVVGIVESERNLAHTGDVVDLLCVHECAFHDGVSV